MSKRETRFSDIAVAFGKFLPYTLDIGAEISETLFETLPTETKISPPYVAYRTFRTFLESLALSMPDRIDRSVFDSKFSGTATSQINSALRTLKLVDTDGRPSETLKKLVRSEGAERSAVLEGILRAYYFPVFRLDLERATKAQFREAMREFGCTESMLVKCETFFIHAATHADIPLSPYLKSNRKSGSRNRSVSRSSRNPSRQPILEDSERSNGQSPGDTIPSSLTMSELMVRVLDKYPDFDPTWSQETQASWMEGMNKLQDTFKIRNGSVN